MEKTVIRDCTIFRGDCLEMLETIPPGSVDCVWTDPPFGVSYVPNKGTACPERKTWVETRMATVLRRFFDRSDSSQFH